MFYVYVLYGQQDKKFYIGYSKDLRRRIAEHRMGKVRSTNERYGCNLIFYESFKSKDDARRRERYLKTTKGRSTLRQMLRDSIK